MGSKKSVTVGYRYYLGLHFGLCHGPADSVKRVIVGERQAWVGEQTASGAVAINAPDLFGGDKREGGVVGQLDVLMGEATQVENGYLQSKLGAAIPAFRGILSAVWRGGQVTANNPYLKPWAFTVQRILQGWSGATAWLPSKAQISNAKIGEENSYVGTLDHPVETTGWLGWVVTSVPPVSGTVDEIGSFITDLRNTKYLEVYGPAAEQVVYLSATYDSRVGRIDAFGYRSTESPANKVGVASVGGVYMVCSGGGAPAWNTDGGAESGYVSCATVLTDSYDMNPAHIIYQCLTDTAWGMGYPAAAIDELSFIGAAYLLYSEGFGLSLLWNKQEPVESFMQIVLDHVGGILYVQPDTAKFALRLVRANYDRETLPQYGPATLVSAEGYQRQAWGETVNEITVVYTNPATEKSESVTVQDIANVAVQGGVVAQTRNYPGIRNAILAQRVAMRDLQAGSTPLASIKLTATRAAWQVFPGDVFRLTWPEYGIDDVVYRVLSVNRGTLTDGQIVIDAVEDVFGLPDNTYLVEQPGGWVDPSQPPAAAPYRKLIEAPYWDLARNLTAADLDYVDALSGYLETLAARPSGDAINYEIQAKVGAAAYEAAGNGDFCPSATVVGAMTKTTASITLANGIDLDLVEPGGYAIINDEYVLVSAIDATAGTATISRGLLDTVPAEHAAGARIWFADGDQGYSSTEYADGETVDVKLLPATGQGTLDVSLAPVDSLTFDQRQYRPYAPGKVLVNTETWPEWIDGLAELTVSWAHRDRLAQTAYLVEQGEASIGPEAGVTYDLRIHDESDGLIYTESLSGTSYTFSAALEAGGTEDPYWSGVTMLLNMTGTDGSTTFTDSSGTPQTYTASGNAHIEADQYKYGGASGYFDGASDLVIGPTGYAGFNLGSGDFTLDGWIYRSAGGSSVQHIAGFWDTSGSSMSWQLGVGSTGYLFFQYSLAGSYDASRSKATAAGVVPTGQWVYFEWNRSGSTMKLRINGADVLSHTCGSDTIHFPSSAAFKIGSNNSANHLFAYLQDLRLMKGGARNATVPTAAAARYLGGSGRANGRLRFELEAKRAGLVSYQKHHHTVLREGYGFNYGYYYGGQ